MGAYAYEAPSNLSDAISLLDEHAKEGRRAQLLAGGTDLLVQMRSVDNTPRTIIDIKKLAETNRLEINGEEIFIGSAIASAELYENEELKGLLPGLLEHLTLSDRLKFKVGQRWEVIFVIPLRQATAYLR